MTYISHLCPYVTFTSYEVLGDSLLSQANIWSVQLTCTGDSGGRKNEPHKPVIFLPILYTIE